MMENRTRFIAVLVCMFIGIPTCLAHNYALKFPSSNSHLKLPSSEFGGGDLTIEGEFHIVGNGILFSFASSAIASPTFSGFVSNNRLYLRGASDVSHTSWVLPNAWNHLAIRTTCVSSRRHYEVFIGGVAKTAVTSGANDACIARKIYSTFYLNRLTNSNWGLIYAVDNFRVWDRSLTDTEISHSASAASSFSGARLALGFSFNEGFGQYTSGSTSDANGDVNELTTKATLVGNPIPTWISRQVSDATRRCTGSGDPHYTSFASNYWSPQGNPGWFVFVDCCGLQIHVNQQSCVPSWATAACVRGVRIHAFGDTILFNHVGNGVRSLSYGSGPNAAMTKMSSYTQATTNGGMFISLNDLNAATTDWSLQIPLYGTFVMADYQYYSLIYLDATQFCYDSTGVCGPWQGSGNKVQVQTTDWYPPSKNGPVFCPESGPQPKCCQGPPTEDSFCGDGIRNGNEQCDDGNDRTEDGCDNCYAEVCGDGKKNRPGEECDDGNFNTGDGCSAKCKREYCGDGVRNANKAPVDQALWEECDDQNLQDGDGCTSTCKQEYCGDGVKNNKNLEECDDGNYIAGDGCTPNCKLEYCGDGVKNNVNEECDDGNTVGNDDCSPTCKIEVCGDGVVNNPNPDGSAQEQCDDGNTVDGDGCSGKCRKEVCGDGSINNAGAENCDDGNAVSLDGCSATCQIEVCGDGIVNNAGREQCDDGNTAAGDGCSAACLTEKCGDGIINNAGAENCDDGNVFPGDGCSATCKTEFCGDGVVNNGGTEECDDGNNVDSDGCNSVCIAEFCGDGLVNNGEQCDDGGNAPHDGCSKDCINEICGNGFVTTSQPSGTETCDDGNLVSNDGCSANCVKEFCGDNIINNVNEQCDDGNAECGDGCCACVEEFCGDNTVNDNPIDPGTGQVIVHENCEDGNTVDKDGCTKCIKDFCGDAILNNAGSEECDDGNSVSGDGCNAQCKDEFCGDGLTNDAGKEECDDGNNVAGDGCDAACKREYCGDGINNNRNTEQCDDGNSISGDGCDANCVIEFCGDGIPDNNCNKDCKTGKKGAKKPEQCDDGNNIDGDGCDSKCVIEYCGDGIVNNVYEECEDLNVVEGDGCFDCIIYDDDWANFEPLPGCDFGSAADNRITEAQAATICARAVLAGTDAYNECMFDVCATGDPVIPVGLLNKLNEDCLRQELVTGRTICPRQCPSDCAEHGLCNAETGLCECVDGWTGADCQNPVNFRCYTMSFGNTSRKFFTHPTSPFTDKTNAIQAFSEAIRAEDSIYVYINEGTILANHRLDIFVVNDAVDTTGGSYKLDVSIPVAQSAGIEHDAFDNEVTAGTFNTATGTGSFTYQWDAYSKNGGMLGPLSNTGSYCVKLAISQTQGIQQVLVGSGNLRQAIDLMKVPAGSWDDIQICASDCTDDCANKDCQECAAAPQCGWCVEREECTLGDPTGPRQHVCKKWRYTNDVTVNRVLKTNFGFPVNPAKQEIFLSTAGTDLPVDVTVEVYDPQVVVWDVALAFQNTKSYADDLSFWRNSFPNLWSMLDDYPLISMSISSFASSSTPSATGDFLYKTNLPITPFKNANYFNQFKQTLDAMASTSVTASSLAQLSALKAMSNLNEVEFRENARRVIILFTDSPFAVGGEHPSVQTVRDLLLDGAIIPFFAVTSSVRSTYEKLVQDLGFGWVFDLNADSSNGLSVIVDALDVATGQVSMVVQQAGHSISTSQTFNGLPHGSRAKFQIEMREVVDEARTTKLVSPGFGSATIENIKSELPEATAPLSTTFDEDPLGGYIIHLSGKNPYWESPIAARVLTIPTGGALYQYDDAQEAAHALGAAAGTTTAAPTTTAASAADNTVLQGAVIANGDIVTDTNNRVIFVPTTNANGSPYTTITYQVTDGCADSPSRTITLNVIPVNDAPVTHTQSVPAVEDTPVLVTVTGEDVESSTLTFRVATPPNHGSLWLGDAQLASGASFASATTTSATVTYKPSLNYFGVDTFSVVSNDGDLDSSPAIITMNISPVNDAPTGNTNDPLTTSLNIALLVQMFLQDVDSDGLSVTAVTVPDKGFLYSKPSLAASTLVSAGDVFPCDANKQVLLWYSPPEYQFGSPFASFTWRVNDNEDRYLPNSLTSPVYTTEFNVLWVNSKPATPTGDGKLIANEDEGKIYVCSATDVDNDPLTISLVNLPALGDLYQVKPDGTRGEKITPTTVFQLTDTEKRVWYQPPPDAFGSFSTPFATFSYRAFDSQLWSVARPVNIYVLPVNDPPTCALSTVSTQEDFPSVIFLAAHDIDNEDGFTFMINSVMPANEGYILTAEGFVASELYQLSDDPVVIYMPATDFNGATSFSYRASDPAGGFVDCTVAISVAAVNDPPAPASTGGDGEEDSLILVGLIGYDVDSPKLTATVRSLPSVGTLYNIAEDGSQGSVLTSGVVTNSKNLVGYLPPANKNSDNSVPETYIVATFTFSVNDGEFESDVGTVGVFIAPVNDAPATTTSTTMTAYEDEQRTRIQLLGSDLEHDALRGKIISFTAPAGCLLQHVVNGQMEDIVDYVEGMNVYFTPALDQSGDGYAVITYAVNDGQLDSANIATVTVNVLPVNDPPRPTLSSVLRTDEDTVMEFNVGGFDPESDSYFVEITQAPEDRGKLEMLMDTWVPVTAGVVPAKWAPWPMRFTPEANDNAINYNSWAYRFSDGENITVEYDVLMSVRSVNDPPLITLTIARTPTTLQEHTIELTLVEDEKFTLNSPRVSDLDIGFNPFYGSARCTSAGKVAIPEPDDAFSLTVVSDQELTFIVDSDNVDRLLAAIRYTALKADGDPSVTTDDLLVISLNDGGASGGCVPENEDPLQPCIQTATISVSIEIQQSSNDALSNGQIGMITGAGAAVVVGGVLGAWKLKGKAMAESEEFTPWSGDWGDDMVVSNPMYEGDRWGANTNPLYQSQD